MKYCSQCGTEMQDDDIFCPECGSKSIADVPSESVIGVIAPSVTPRQRMLRGVAGSKCTRNMAISSTAYFVLSLISSVLTMSMMANTLENLLNYYSYDYYADFAWIGKIIGSFISSSSMITYAFVILHFVALWSIYKWAGRTDKVAPAGFTVLKVIYILNIIKLCLIAFILAIATVFMIIAATVTGEYEFVIAASVLSVIAFLILALYAVAVIYNVKWLKLLNGATEICRSGTTAKKPSTFLVVINCIIVGFISLSLISSLTVIAVPSNLLINLYTQNLYDTVCDYDFLNIMRALLNVVFPPFYVKIWSVLASVANVVYMICETVFLVKYNSGLKNTK